MGNRRRTTGFNKETREDMRTIVYGLGFTTERPPAGQSLQETEIQLLHPRITDTVLLPAAKLVLSQLNMEREAPKARQGYPDIRQTSQECV